MLRRDGGTHSDARSTHASIAFDAVRACVRIGRYVAEQLGWLLRCRPAVYVRRISKIDATTTDDDDDDE